MWNHFYSKSTNPRIDVLDDLVYNHNHTRHTTTLMKPTDANQDTKGQVMVTLYGHTIGTCQHQCLGLGVQEHIHNGYEAICTEELLRVTKVFRLDPVVHNIELF